MESVLECTCEGATLCYVCPHAKIASCHSSNLVPVCCHMHEVVIIIRVNFAHAIARQEAVAISVYAV